MYHPGSKMKYLRNGDARPTIHMGWWEWIPIFRDRTPFKTGGSFHGERQDGPVSLAWGHQLPERYVTLIRKEQPDYVVYSYATPIAWHHAAGWTIPNVKYSQTTTRHQHAVSMGVDHIADAANYGV
jgi:hypothetical protein